MRQVPQNPPALCGQEVLWGAANIPHRKSLQPSNEANRARSVDLIPCFVSVIIPRYARRRLQWLPTYNPLSHHANLLYQLHSAYAEDIYVEGSQILSLSRLLFVNGKISTAEVVPNLIRSRYQRSPSWECVIMSLFSASICSFHCRSMAPTVEQAISIKVCKINSTKAIPFESQ